MMNISKEQLKTRMNSIIDLEVLDRIKAKMDTQKASQDKGAVYRPVSMPYLTGRARIEDPAVFKGNIEKFYGIAQLPVGLMGPIKVNGPYSGGQYYVPLATTEGALVASYNRGAKVITQSGGANVLVTSETVTRSPGFIFTHLMEAAQFVAWVTGQFELFKEIVGMTTRHGHLEDFDAQIDGNYVWLTFKYVSGDASGQNMVTIATDLLCQYIEKFAPVRPKKWYVEGNLSGDKKATRLAQYAGRGKNVLAEVTVDKDRVKRMLHTTPEAIVEYSRMAMVAGIRSGSIGINGHFANALAAIFIACGQDAACVAESAVGTSRAELTEAGDLYVSINLPNLMVGTVGGGTHLPTQREALELMGCYGDGQAKKFAEICAAAVLAGEISIAAAIAAGQFTQAHKKYARTKKINKEIYDEHRHSIRQDAFKGKDQ